MPVRTTDAPAKNESIRIAKMTITDGHVRRSSDRRPLITRLRSATARQADHSVRAGFTLIELLIVIGIMGVLLVLIAPAFTSIKGGTDVTSAAYTIKGTLDTARTYAKANNTYTWVGFKEVDVSQNASASPQLNGTGRVAVAIVASKDGTRGYDITNPSLPNPSAWT